MQDLISEPFPLQPLKNYLRSHISYRIISIDTLVNLALRRMHGHHVQHKYTEVTGFSRNLMVNEWETERKIFQRMGNVFWLNTKHLYASWRNSSMRHYERPYFVGTNYSPQGRKSRKGYLMNIHHFDRWGSLYVIPAKHFCTSVCTDDPTARRISTLPFTDTSLNVSLHNLGLI